MSRKSLIIVVSIVVMIVLVGATFLGTSVNEKKISSEVAEIQNEIDSLYFDASKEMLTDEVDIEKQVDRIRNDISELKQEEFSSDIQKNVDRAESELVLIERMSSLQLETDAFFDEKGVLVESVDIVTAEKMASDLEKEKPEFVAIEREKIDNAKAQQAAKELASQPPVKDTDFVNVKSVDNSIIVDLKYNTTDNFTGKRIYNFDQAILRNSTAQKLANANAILKEQGYVIKIWDAYRPMAAQQTLWDAYPDPNFVAKPNANKVTGHQLGATIDITLCTLDGEEVQMQSEFDDFSSSAYRSYARNPEQEKYYQMMDSAMKQAGFEGYENEWWEYRDTNQDFEPLQVDPSLY